MLSWRRPSHSERSLPDVFTPPRDDPATRPRRLSVPKDADTDDGGARVTGQACGMLAAVACLFVVACAVIIVLYTVTSTLMGKRRYINCEDQHIENGIVKADVANATPRVECFDGYVLQEPPDLKLRCELVNKHCIVLRPASVENPEPLLKCKESYAFIVRSGAASGAGTSSKARTNTTDFEDPLEIDWRVANVSADTYHGLEGICVSDYMLEHEKQLGKPSSPVKDTQRLFGQQRLALHGATSDGPGRLGGSRRWSGPGSTAATMALVVLSLAAVVGAGVSRAAVDRGRAGNEPDTMDKEPETAPLLDVEPPEIENGVPASRRGEGPAE